MLLFSLLFGIVEFGLAFRDRLTVSNATQGAVRVGSALGDSADSDYQVLTSLEASLGTLPNSGIGVINYVDIFLADGNGDPAGSCATGDRCNRYHWNPGATPSCDWSPCPAPDGSGGITGSYGGSWDPSSRDTQLPDLDVMGVQLAFGHNWVTGGLIPLPDATCSDGSFGTDCWKDTAIMRLEPQQFDS